MEKEALKQPVLSHSAPHDAAAMAIMQSKTRTFARLTGLKRPFPALVS